MKTDRERLIELVNEAHEYCNTINCIGGEECGYDGQLDYLISKGVTIPVRCHDCIHAVPLDRNCELNASVYMHCNLFRGDLINNVWHKYKRYYKDYSIVEHDDFCSYGERKEE